MSTRATNREQNGGSKMSFESLLSPCETYEGSRHYTAFEGAFVAVASADPVSDKTVIMSSELLSELRAQLRAQALRDPPHTRPTQPSLPAIRAESRTGRY